MDEEQDAARGFRVTDRRRFTDAGETRPEEPAGGAPPPAADPSSGPALTFATFVLGLSTQALVALGEMEHPVTKQRDRDPAGARQLIDILALLRDKTRGNLQPDEDNLLESVLYDLRMRFVDLVRGSGK